MSQFQSSFPKQPLPIPKLPLQMDPRFSGIFERWLTRPITAAAWDLNATFSHTEAEAALGGNPNWALALNGSGTATSKTGGGLRLTTGTTSGNDNLVIPNTASVVTTGFSTMTWDLDLQNYHTNSLVTGSAVTGANYFSGFKVDNDFGVDDADLFGFSYVAAEGAGSSWALAGRNNSAGIFTNAATAAVSNSVLTGLTVAASTLYRVECFLDPQRYPTWIINDQVWTSSAAKPYIYIGSTKYNITPLRGGTSSVHPAWGVETVTTTTARILDSRVCQFYQLFE